MSFNNNGRAVCDRKDCGEFATVEYQGGYILKWELNKKGDYKKGHQDLEGMSTWTEHYCDEHDDN